MVSIVIRTVILYFVLTFSLRIMGKRQIGELDVGELVSTLLISEVAAIPIDDPDIPLLNALIPTLLIISAEILISAFKNRSEKLKKTVEGEPCYIIYKGKLLQNALKDNRISVDELLSELRIQGVFDIREVYHAILEQNGKLSITKKGDKAVAHAIIIDGEIIGENLRICGITRPKIEEEIKIRGLKKSDVFLMTATDGKDINIIKKEENV